MTHARWAWRLAALTVVVVAAVQWAMVRPDIRAWLSALDRLESVDATSLVAQVNQEDPAAVRAARPALSPVVEPQLTLVLTNAATAPHVTLWKGEESVGDFAQGVAFVQVRSGEVVRIDARRDSRPLSFEVLGSQWLTTPLPGPIYVQGQVADLPAVILRFSP